MSKVIVSQNQLSLFTGETNPNTSPFDAIRHFDENGQECWYARELMSTLEYTKWSNFKSAIARAKKSCKNSANDTTRHFTETSKTISLGDGIERSIVDVKLSRYACYLIAMNGDPTKPVVAAAQTYFVGQARRQELAQANAQLRHNQNVTAHMLRGKSQEWAETRITSSETQKALNGGLMATHVDNKPDFGKVAQTQNKELFDKTRNEIIEELGLTAAQSKKYRDYLGKYALQAVNLVNKASLKKMQALGRNLTTEEQTDIVREQAQRAARIMREAADMEGIDFLSGAPLDDDGNALIQRQRPLLPRGKAQ